MEFLANIEEPDRQYERRRSNRNGHGKQAQVHGSSRNDYMRIEAAHDSRRSPLRQNDHENSKN